MGYAILLTDLPDGIDLILHQCDEGRYDDGRALHDEGRQLVTQGLSPTRGHQHESVASVQQVADDGFLVTFERVETEIAF